MFKKIHLATDKQKAILAVILGSLLGGAVSPLTKLGLKKIPPFTFSFLRFAIASLSIWPFYLKKGSPITKKYKKLIIISFLPILNIILFVFGVKLTTASTAQMLYAASPILAGVFSFFILGLILSTGKWIAIIIGFLGALIVIILPAIEKASPFIGDIRGNILIIFAVIAWSLYLVLSKKIQNNFSPLVITSIFIFQAALFFLIMAATETHLYKALWESLNITSIISILYIGVIGTVVTYLLFQYAIKYGGPIVGTLSFYLLPISSYVLSYLILGERLTWGLALGTIVVFASITAYSFIE